MMINLFQCCKSRLKPTTMCITKLLQNQQQRHCGLMKVSDQMETLLKKLDSIPERCRLVYRQKEHRVSNFIYHSVNLLSVVSLSGLSYFWYIKYKDPNFEISENLEDVYDPYQCGAMIALNFFMLWAAGLLRKRWVIRIYHDPNRRIFQAIYYGRLPFTTEQFHFPENSLSYVNKDSGLPWKNTLFQIDNINSKRKIMLFNERFRTYDDFYKMLRRDQVELD